MREITHIIVHCSDSEWGSAREIDKWHKERGFEEIGYHFVILNGRVKPKETFLSMDGSIECGRDLEKIGAHCIGFNESSIGVCLILKSEPRLKQLDALRSFLEECCRKYGIQPEDVLGHCETSSGKAEGKTCPNFTMEPIRVWLRGRLV